MRVVRFQGGAVIAMCLPLKSHFCEINNTRKLAIIFFIWVQLVNFDNVTLQCEPLAGWSGTTSQIEAILKEIHEKEALNAIFILNCQIIPNWVCTFKNWMEYDRQLMVCNITSSPALPVEGPNSHTDMSPPCWLEDFFCSQVEYARDFVVSHLLLQTGKIDREKFKPSLSGLNLPC